MGESLASAVTWFLLSAAGTAAFGIYMTHLADELSQRTRLGRAIIGAVFLGALTSIGEIGTSITAALEGRAELAASNALGSIAAQTAFIAIADLAYRRGNLEYAAAAVPNLMLMGLLLVCLALLVLAGAVPAMAWWSVHPASIMLIAAYLYGMRLVAQSGVMPMWRAEHLEDEATPASSISRGGSLTALWLRFLLAGLSLATCGVMLAKSGIALVRLTGLSETYVGALLTGVTSSMPELVTAITAVRIGALTLAIANIAGGNVFDSVIVAFSDIAYRPGSIYLAAGDSLMVLVGTALLMNAIVLLGLVRRERYGPGNIGLEGVLLLAIYGGLVAWLV